MRRLMVSEFITIDGVAEAPGGEPGHPHTGWVLPYIGPELEEYKGREVREAGSLLIGRVTYDDFVEAFPQLGPGDPMNVMPKHVVSATVSAPLPWSHATLLEGDPIAAVAALKQGEGGSILVHGSLTLARAPLDAGLVDDLRLMVFPIVVGGGRSIFPAGFRMSSFTLASTEMVLPNVPVQTWALTA